MPCLSNAKQLLVFHEHHTCDTLQMNTFFTLTLSPWSPAHQVPLWSVIHLLTCTAKPTRKICSRFQAPCMSYCLQTLPATRITPQIDSRSNSRNPEVEFLICFPLPSLSMHSLNCFLRKHEVHLKGSEDTHVYCGTIHNSQVMETAKMPHHWWKD
jgi:hypothetical protein